MRLSWQGWGRKVYDYPPPFETGGQIALEWHRLDGETYYLLFGIRNEIRRVILEFRVPDFGWQDRCGRLLDE